MPFVPDHVWPTKAKGAAGNMVYVTTEAADAPNAEKSYITPRA